MIMLVLEAMFMILGVVVTIIFLMPYIQGEIAAMESYLSKSIGFYISNYVS